MCLENGKRDHERPSTAGAWNVYRGGKGLIWSGKCQEEGLGFLLQSRGSSGAQLGLSGGRGDLPKTVGKLLCYKNMFLEQPFLGPSISLWKLLL